MSALARRRWPVRWLLIGIVFGLVLPGLVFCGSLLVRFDHAERKQARSAALQAAVRGASAVDREFGNLIVALRVFATSSALGATDPARLDGAARRAASAIGHDVVLLDPSGQELVDTAAAPGGSLPVSPAQEALRRALASNRAEISDLLTPTGRPAPIVALVVPVAGARVAALALYMEPAYFTQLLTRQGLPEGWVASLVDGAGRLLARNLRSERYLGHPVPADFMAHAGPAPVWATVGMDGIPLLVASVPVNGTAWRSAIGVPLNRFEQPVRRSVLWLAFGGAVLLALGCCVAWYLARQVTAPLAALALAGRALGRGQAVPAVHSRLREFDEVSRALVQGAAALQARTDALLLERAQLEAIIETVPVGLLIAEAPSGAVLAGNGHLERMLRQPGLLPGVRYRSVALAEDGAVLGAAEDPLLRALAGEEYAERQCRYPRGDGTWLWVQLIAAPIRANDGAVTGAVMALLDIDEVVRAREIKARSADQLEAMVVQRTAELERAAQQLRDEIAARGKAEGQLRQVQKMEAVGRLTGGIAHDFNNMLTVVIGSLDLLRRKATDARAVRLLDNALDGAGRAAALTARLLAFSRQQPLLPQRIDVNGLVSGMSDLLLRTLGELVEVETVLDPTVWPVHADPNQLENALLNLAVNARDAILERTPAGGRITIRTGNMHLDAAFAARAEDVRVGDYVLIAVADTGAGMTEEVLNRVFEPFFTTKLQGQGTGLGLSQVHGFVMQSGGHVDIETAPGIGTTVRLYLPRTEAEIAGRPAPAPLAEAMSLAGETVLVVEDEGGVRRFTTEALRELGYRVLAADGAAGALRLLDAHPETALLMTDVVMAGVGGLELAEAVQRRRPELPVLFCTGYRGSSVLQDGASDPLRAVIEKPFTVLALGTMVRTMLAGAAQPVTAGR